MLKYSIICFVLFASSCAKLPDFIQKCVQKDPKVGECMVARTNEVLPRFYDHGNKDLKIPKLVPLVLPHVERKNDNFQFSLDNVTIEGFNTIKAVKFTPNFETKKGVFKFHGDHFEITGSYDVDARILILPIKGQGPFKLVFDDVTFIFTMQFEFYDKDGQMYSKMVNSTLEWEAGKSKYQLDNLFNGDKTLGDEMNKFLNENAKDVNKDVGFVIIDVLKQMVDGAFVTLVDNNAMNEIFEY